MLHPPSFSFFEMEMNDQGHELTGEKLRLIGMVIYFSLLFLRFLHSNFIFHLWIFKSSVFIRSVVADLLAIIVTLMSVLKWKSFVFFHNQALEHVFEKMFFLKLLSTKFLLFGYLRCSVDNKQTIPFPPFFYSAYIFSCLRFYISTVGKFFF